MENLVEKLQIYLGKTLNLKISICRWKEQGKLPFFLIDSYDFFETSLLNNPCLLMVSKNDDALTPNTIQKHWELVTKKRDIPCIYISNTISSYNRKRLIQHHIPFIVLGNQIYIPDLGLDLREHFKQQRIRNEFFSPSTQMVIISALLGKKNERLNPTELVNQLGYSHMTMTRAFNELEAAGIGKMINQGKERWWIIEKTKKDLWEQTKSMLRSPIRNRELMKLFPTAKMPQLLSGISALAETTMINPPSIPVFAMGVEEYRQINIPKGLHLSAVDEAELELEIWNYDPKLFSNQGKVDPFSLYLSLRGTKDERIEAALEELMETITW